MYWNNYSYFNPAMSGVKYKHEANATYRNQWEKVDGAPNTFFVNYGTNLADKHGLGVNYAFDETGFSKSHRVKLNYNYQLKLDETRKLVFGTALNIQNQRVTADWITPETINDPSLPSNYSINLIGVDLGVAYYGKKITAGLAATQVPIYRSAENYTPAIHLFGNLRYELQLEPHPGFLIFETKLRTDLVKYSQDFNVGYNYGGIVEAGIGYRTSDAILFNVTGILKKKYRIGYLYEMTINKLNSVSRGTHEIAIGLRIPN